MFSELPKPLRLTVCAPMEYPPQGTAWLIDRRYVVTAFHVVGIADDWIHDIYAPTPVSYNLEIADHVVDLRTLPMGRFKDVAVFELSAPVDAAIESACSYDRLDANPLKDREYRAEGYWTKDPTAPQPRTGNILDVQSERLILSVNDGTQLDWGGLSGSAVTQGRWVVGLLCADVVDGGRAYAAPVTHIDNALKNCRTPKNLPPPQSPGKALDTQSDFHALFDAVACSPAWSNRVRATSPWLSPDFALVHLTSRQRDNPAVQRLLWSVVVGMLIVLSLILTLLILLWPSRHSEYYLRHLCLAEVSVLIAGVTIAVVSNFAAGLGAASVGALVGGIATRVAIEFTPRGHPGTAVAMGTFLGTTAAIATILDAPRRAQSSVHFCSRLVRFAIDAANSGVVLVLIGLTVWVMSRLMAPIDRQHDLSLMVLVCAGIGLVVGGVVGWAARCQRRRKSVLPNVPEENALLFRICVPYTSIGVIAGLLVAHEMDWETAPAYGIALGVLVGGFVGSTLTAMQAVGENQGGGGPSKLFAAISSVAVFTILLSLGVFVSFPGRVETVGYTGLSLMLSFGAMRAVAFKSSRQYLDRY